MDKHTTKDKLDNDISCILEEVETASIKLPPIFLNKEGKPVEKQKRVQLYENRNVVLEQRGNRYYLSLYDKEGKFQRGITINVRDDYKVGLVNYK